MLRRFIPKGKSISDYTAEDVCFFADCINGLPRKILGYKKIADTLGTTTEYLLGGNEIRTMEALENSNSRAAKDIDELVSEVTGMFTGGTLSDETLESAMKALNDAYWSAKEKNSEYASKKYLKFVEND